MSDALGNNPVSGGNLTIGKLARAAGTNLETVRYYEREGIMPAPPRSEGGHRQYGLDHLKRLRFVRRCRELGYTLDQVRGLLGFVDGGGYTCADVRAMTLAHLSEIERKIADLQAIGAVLDDMARQCDGGDVPDCPIIDALFRENAA